MEVEERGGDRQTDRHRDGQTERVVPFFSSERFGHDVS